jgi:metal-responsive CopG/Arc/MetJ family transcriptional regulator
MTKVILWAMKTAISIPDPVFQAADVMANKLGMSRSQLFTAAMSEYMKLHKYDDVTEALNKIYSNTEESIDDDILLMQSHSIQKEEW